jgi:hypothetical protein
MRSCTLVALLPCGAATGIYSGNSMAGLRDTVYFRKNTARRRGAVYSNNSAGGQHHVM